MGISGISAGQISALATAAVFALNAGCTGTVKNRSGGDAASGIDGAHEEGNSAADAALPSDGAQPPVGDEAGDAVPGDDSAGDVAPGDAFVPCNPTTTGLAAPLPACTASHKCHPGLPNEQTVPSAPPACVDPRWTTIASHEVADFTRYACIFEHPEATTDQPRPLVIWFHGGGEGAATIEETHLLDRATDTQLSGVAGRLGFHLIAVHGRRLFYPTAHDRHGEYHHDFYYRDLASPSTNPDVANADAWVDFMVGNHAVDPQRIYAMGWSNGAFFSQLYSVARHATPTPGGARVAAAAVFAAGDPFDDIDRDPFADQPWGHNPSCRLQPRPTSDVPILVVYRTCDAATPCGSSDVGCFGADPGYVISAWVAAAPGLGLTGLQGYLINGLEAAGGLDSDAATCSTIPSPCALQTCQDNSLGIYCLCMVNHLRWPDGQYGASTGIDREPGMLLFLRSHPLP